jgi:hypothetical protein
VGGLACGLLVAATCVILPGAAPAAADDGLGVDTTSYTPVGPVRLADTRRTECGCTRLDGSTIRVPVAGRDGVPDDATAAALTLTVAEARSDGGYVTIWPAGSARPETSVLNFRAGQTRANSAIVLLGDGGAVDVYVYGGAHLIIDVSGAFVPTVVAAAGRFVPLDEASRVLDTRQSGAGGRVRAGGVSAVGLPDGVPDDAVALAVNITTTATADGLGYVTAWPADTTMPESSLLNSDGPNQDRAAFAIVPVTPSGLSLYTFSGGHLIVDVVGYFSGPTALPGADGLFVPHAPERVTDTRSEAVPLYPGSAMCIDAGDGAAVAANVTVTDTWGAGYVTGWAAGTPMPSTSNVNATAQRETVANSMIAQRSSLGVAMYASVGTQLLVDVAGWFTGTPAQEALTTVGLPSLDPLSRPVANTPAEVCGMGNGRFSCAGGLDDAELTAYFAGEHGGLFGADYQRAAKLPDGRVLWLFQDAMVRTPGITARLVHNVAVVQSGLCFNLLHGGSEANPQSWVGADQTDTRHHWFWPLGSAMGNDGQLHIFYMEVVEHGDVYLTLTEPVATWVASVNVDDLTVTRFERAPDPGTRLYGWSVTSDDEWTYLYANCNRQFGWSENGHDPCTGDLYLARVPKGELLAKPEYRTRTGWSTNESSAVPVIKASEGRSVNPSQVQWDGHQFVAVTKDSDWFGQAVWVDRASNAWGPWTMYDSIVPPAKCGGCNTYFASWVPWRNNDGSLIIGLSHNRWDGAVSGRYRPTFLTVASAPSN